LGNFDPITFFNTPTMLANFIPLFDFKNGAFIMIVVFGLVIAGLVGAVWLMMNQKPKK